ncbi:MAG: hypothetical protein IPK67_20900 [Planctomycetes bacterium]|nr:hypothetical protein [Planctomycetota bacterium]
MDAGKVLASAPFTIRAGETSTVALVIPEAPPDRFASVVVVVRMDESWDLERLNVYVTDLGLPRTPATGASPATGGERLGSLPRSQSACGWRDINSSSRKPALASTPP